MSGCSPSAAAFWSGCCSDPLMVRRPLLEPNLSVGGMTFIGTSLLIFLMANVINSKLTADDLVGARKAQQVSHLESTAPEDRSLVNHGPGYPLLHLLPVISTQMLFVDDTPRQTPQERDARRDVVQVATARTMAILGHLAVVIGMVLIGFRHFDNIRTGIAAATLYLMLPYTAQMTGRVDHVLPAALLIWAVEAYRRPMVAGALMGLAIGVQLLPAVPAAAVVQLLLASRAAAVWRGRGGDDAGDGRVAGLHVRQLCHVLGPGAADVRLARSTFDDVDGFWAIGLIAPVLSHSRSSWPFW